MFCCEAHLLGKPVYPHMFLFRPTMFSLSVHWPTRARAAVFARILTKRNKQRKEKERLHGAKRERGAKEGSILPFPVNMTTEINRGSLFVLC